MQWQQNSQKFEEINFEWNGDYSSPFNEFWIIFCLLIHILRKSTPKITVQFPTQIKQRRRRHLKQQTNGKNWKNILFCCLSTLFSQFSVQFSSAYFLRHEISLGISFFFVLNSWLGWAEEWWKKWERKKSFMIQLLVEKKIQFRANKNLIRIRHKSPLWWILIHETSSSFFSTRYSLKKLDTLRNWKKCWTMMRAMINEILISFMRILTLDGLKRSLNLITNQTLFSHWWWRLTAQLEFDL